MANRIRQRTELTLDADFKKSLIKLASVYEMSVSELVEFALMPLIQKEERRENESK